MSSNLEEQNAAHERWIFWEIFSFLQIERVSFIWEINRGYHTQGKNLYNLVHNAFPGGVSHGVLATRPSLIRNILDPLRTYCVYCTTIDYDKRDNESSNQLHRGGEATGGGGRSIEVNFPQFKPEYTEHFPSATLSASLVHLTLPHKPAVLPSVIAPTLFMFESKAKLTGRVAKMHSGSSYG